MGGWILAIFGSFRLDADDCALTRRLGPLVVVCRWDEVVVARVEPVLSFRQVRFVLCDRHGQRISFPLFLLSRQDRSRLATLLSEQLGASLRADL